MSGLTFGIDLGIASCGWAVLRHPSTEAPGEIVAFGSWMFDKPETPDKKVPLNQIRRGARLLRRVIRRRRSRMATLRRLFHAHGLLDSDDPGALKRKGLDPWELRARALDRVLTAAELAVALGHIAKRRGFRSSAKRKAGANTAGDDSKMLKAIETTRELAARYRTVGEMFARDPAYAGRRRNRDGQFDRTMSRDEQAAEVRAIFDAQRRLGNASASEELQKAFEKEAFFQRPLQDSERMVGECLFEPGERRAAKLSPSFELFRLLNRLINLRVTTDDGERPLTAAELVAATADLGATATLTSTRVRKLIGLAPEHRFTTIKPEQEKGDIATRTGVALGGTAKLREVLGESNWAQMRGRPDQLDAIAHVVTFFETDETIAQELDKLGLPDPVREALLAGLQANAFAKFNGAGHISAKAARNLLPLLAQGMRYDQACAAVGYDHSATRWGKRPQVVDKAGFNALVRDMGEEIANPIARKAMTEGLKQLWAMRNEWGVPDAIHIELAREVGNSLEERARIQRRLDETTAQRQRERRDVRELLGIDDVGGDTLLRYRLWKEQSSRCLYTDTYIDPRQLLATDNSVQVDHILPWSRFCDDSFSNKTLCLSRANQNKKGATPYEWFGSDEERWAAFAARVEGAKEMKGFKKRNYLLRNAKEAEEKFCSRNLNDTRYAARALAEAARLFYPPGERQDKGGRRRVFTRPGALTAALRQAWGVEALKKVDGKRVEDARHHALDAAVVAAVSEAEVQKLTRSFQEWEQAGLGRPLRQVPEPWDGFRRQLAAMYHSKDHCFVARAERRRARGEGHAATIRQVKERDGAEIVFERKPVEKLTLADLDKIKDADRNGAIIASLRDWIGRGKPADDLPKSPQGDEIRKVRIKAKGKPSVRVRGGTADRGEMVRVDVFTKPNKRGKDEFYLVPIYPHQVMNKAEWPEPPMRSVVAYKDEETGWTLLDDSYTFRFSLYGRSYVETVKPSGESYDGYFGGMHRGTGALNLFDHRDPNTGKDGIGAKTLLSLRKFNVDRFGRRSEIRQEVRTWHGVACTSPTPAG
jgi:CRISPR-associated endonuclease Csn1